ncbi:DUF1287 domain-containing protein [Ornithinibacillus salinisoli]|uniref:DUF1287 domain-containing protein n=1 Tax=Ornithinibacillus salinisoli TaxID=1848459 RepID=A0ABW4W1Q6_9BACI
MLLIIKIIRTTSILIGIFIVIVGYFFIFHSYNDDQYTSYVDNSTQMENQFSLTSDTNKNGITNEVEITSNARDLVGTLYDPLKGSFYDIGGKMGFIVCIDVPRIVFGQAGISLAQLLRDDFEESPEHYETDEGSNTPDTPFFYRRVRNVYDYAKGNDLLIRQADTPQIGDIVFYGRYHATLVTYVHEDGTYDEVEAHPKLIFVKEHKKKEWQPRDVARLFK